MYPNLFIVGSPRCGTTKLYECFKKHKDFYCPNIKEPKYFSPNFQLSRMHLDDYKALYLPGSEKYLVDGSTSYIHDYNALKRIKEKVPACKIIWIRRNPEIAKLSLIKLHKNNYSKSYIDKQIHCKNPRFDYFHIYDFHKHHKNLYEIFDKQQVLILDLENINGWESEIRAFTKIHDLKVDKTIINESRDWKFGIFKFLFNFLNYIVRNSPIKLNLGLMTLIKRILTK